MKLPDGRMLSTPEEIHNEAVVHFADFLSRRTSASVLSLSDLIQEEVRESENWNLCRSPTDQEIKDALFDIPINSSPGPDGFTFGFFQHCWDFIQHDLVEAVRNFFEGTELPRYYTASFLVLIPKMPDPCSFDKFRPISLCSVVYKICSKLIVNRLSAILCRLVSEEQGAFLPGRNDMVIFSTGRKKDVRNILEVLDRYAQWSGQVVNASKSSIFFSNRIPDSRRQELIRVSGFSMGNFPTRYLGVPIFSGRAKSWPVDEGGVGIRNIMDVYSSLQSKFAWKFLSEDTLWSRFFKAKATFEDLDHVLYSGKVAAKLWQICSNFLGIPYVATRSWLVTVEAWFRRTKKSSKVGNLIGLIPCIIIWNLWIWRCSARMEGQNDCFNVLWRKVKYWIHWVGLRLRDTDNCGLPCLRMK
ncbi:hypothetical protein SLA2020_282060 [Shorea laevis]